MNVAETKMPDDLQTIYGSIHSLDEDNLSEKTDLVDTDTEDDFDVSNELPLGNESLPSDITDEQTPADVELTIDNLFSILRPFQFLETTAEPINGSQIPTAISSSTKNLISSNSVSSSFNILPKVVPNSPPLVEIESQVDKMFSALSQFI